MVVGKDESIMDMTGQDIFVHTFQPNHGKIPPQLQHLRGRVNGVLDAVTYTNPLPESQNEFFELAWTVVGFKIGLLLPNYLYKPNSFVVF